jgi:superfamily II DNA or RNA helicase
MARQRTCILSLVEQTGAVVNPISGIPGASLHGGANVVVSRILVMDAPYDALFKDVMKGTPHARFNGTTKTWDVNLLNAAPGVVQQVLLYLTSAPFLTGARDRQFDIALNPELCALASTALAGGPLPTLYDWAGASVVANGTHWVACRDLAALLADMGLSTLPPPAPVPPVVQSYRRSRFPTVPQVPVAAPAAPYQPSPAVNQAAAAAQVHRPPDHGVTPDPTEPESEMTEADPVSLAGSYDRNATTDTELATISRNVTGNLATLPAMPTHVGTSETRKLYTHQREALARIDAAINLAQGDPTRLILAHDPGLGKTTTAVAFAAQHKVRRVVVVCPERARSLWAEHFQRWAGRETFRYGVDASAGREWSETKDGVLIVGYASIIKQSFADKLGRAPFEGDLLIVDEAHYLASNKSKRSLAVRNIAQQFQHVLMLTGTPMLAHPIELFPLLNLANAHAFPSYWQFATKFAGARKTKFGWDVKGASNLPELTRLLAGYMHRVRKSDADLPPKRRVSVPIDLENTDRADMEDAVAEAVAGMKLPTGIPGADVHDGGQASQIAVSGSIRQIVYEARREETLEWIVDWAKGSPDKKLVVFAWNKAVVHDLVQGMTGALGLTAPEIVGLTGDDPISVRDEAIKRFNTDPDLRFLVATIASCGTAYDMHKQCADGVFVQCDWTPGSMIQAEDRLGRAPGGEPVTWYYLAAAGTIDERIIKTLMKKQETFQAVVDGGVTPANHFEDVLHEILQWRAERAAAKAARAKKEAVA